MTDIQNVVNILNSLPFSLQVIHIDYLLQKMTQYVLLGKVIIFYLYYNVESKTSLQNVCFL